MARPANSPTADAELFGDAFRASPIGIAVETVEGQPLFVNPALCSMLGFNEAEMRSKQCQDFSPPEDSQKDWALFQQLRAGSIHHYQVEKRYFRGDGSLMWGRLSVSLLNGPDSPLVLAMVEDITQRKQMEEALSDVARKLVEAQEKERARIARELHDDINQRLALLSMEVEQLQANPSEIEPRGQRLRKGIHEISADVETLAHDLHPSRLEYLGAVEGMRSWSKDFAERQKLVLDFTSDVRNPMPPEIGVSLFRVLQEALQNAVKHSGVKRVEVKLQEDSESLHLVVRDAGRGFDVQAASRGKRLGLTSMRERIRLVNGTLTIDSKPNGGTAIEARVPFGAGPSPQRQR